MIMNLLIGAVVVMFALMINIFVAMACTKRIDKYWVLHPEWESSFLYFQLNRFHKYGYYVIINKPTILPLPKAVKLWVGISFVVNVIVFIPLIGAGLIHQLFY